jgi:hypothetical protein
MGNGSLYWVNPTFEDQGKMENRAFPSSTLSWKEKGRKRKRKKKGNWFLGERKNEKARAGYHVWKRNQDWVVMQVQT